MRLAVLISLLAAPVTASTASAQQFFRSNQLRDAAADVPVPSNPLTLMTELCACAAFYPELIGSKAPFEDAT